MKFKKGESGNPKGRPRGGRNAITKAVLDIVEGEIDASLADGNGLAELRRDRPDVFWRFVSSLIPKELDIDTRPPVSFTMVLHDDKPLITNDSPIERETETLPVRPTQTESFKINGGESKI